LRYKLVSAFLLIIVVLSLFNCAYATPPYQNYTYNDRGTGVEPQAYIYEGLINGKTLGISNLSSPQDVYVSNDGLIYIADSGNNRIIVIDINFKVIKIISEFDNNGKIDKFNNPKGVFVALDNTLYIADTDNCRIIILDKDGKLLSVFGKPETFLISSELQYKPLKVTANFQKRINVVVAGMTAGLIELEKDGSFMGFYGAIPVVNDKSDIWRFFQTKEQRERAALAIPTVYNNLDIDNEGFIYGTINLEGGAHYPVARLNPSGMDILRRYGRILPCGDPFLWDNETFENKSSNIVDVCAKEFGMYSLLDATHGRIFTYDYDGNLLYIFGGYGEQAGTFGLPTAIDSIKGDRFLVVDGKLNQIVVFAPTQYGKLITEATQMQFQRKYVKAGEKWSEVINYTSKFAVAYVGAGKALLRQKDYSQAMTYFETGKVVNYYSIAFSYFRQELMSKYFGQTITIVIIFIILLIIICKILKMRAKRRNIFADKK